jgi:hypothetical protein
LNLPLTAAGVLVSKLLTVRSKEQRAVD